MPPANIYVYHTVVMAAKSKTGVARLGHLSPGIAGCDCSGWFSVGHQLAPDTVDLLTNEAQP